MRNRNLINMLSQLGDEYDVRVAIDDHSFNIARLYTDGSQFGKIFVLLDEDSQDVYP